MIRLLLTNGTARQLPMEISHGLILHTYNFYGCKANWLNFYYYSAGYVSIAYVEELCFKQMNISIIVYVL